MKIGARLGGIAAIGVAVVALGACGNPIAHLTTERAVGNAVDEALAGPGLHLQMSLGATPAQLLQIDRAEHGDRSFTPRLASALARTSIVVNVYPGAGESIQSKQFATDPNNQFELAMQTGDATPVDVRYLGGVVYARADLGALLSDFGQKPAAAAGVQKGLAQANTYLPGVAALSQDKWVSANLQQLAPLAHLGGLNTASNSKHQASSTALLNHLKSALAKNTSYANLGNHGGRTEYQLTIQARAVMQQVAGDLSNLAGSIPIPGGSGITSQMTQALAKAPRAVVIQLWVKHNKAQEVDLDLNQFAHKYPFAVPLRVLIESGSRVSKPSGATPLDFSKIAPLIGGLGGSGGAPAS